MPSTKKRINLTVDDVLYQRIYDYKVSHGIDTLTSTCMQLITQQLNSIAETEAMLKVINASSMEQLSNLAKVGLEQIKSSGKL